MPTNHELSWQAWSGFLTSDKDVWEAAMAELDSRHPTFDVAWAWAIAYVQLRRPHRDRCQPWSAVATQVGASTDEARMHSTAIAALIGAAGNDDREGAQRVWLQLDDRAAAVVARLLLRMCAAAAVEAVQRLNL